MGANLAAGFTVGASVKAHPVPADGWDEALVCGVCNEYMWVTAPMLLLREMCPDRLFLCCLCGEVGVAALQVLLDIEVDIQAVPDLGTLRRAHPYE